MTARSVLQTFVTHAVDLHLVHIGDLETIKDLEDLMGLVEIVVH